MGSVTLELLNGAGLMGTLALVAVGLGIVFGLMDVINLAHGEFIMLGAYVAVVGARAGVNHWLAVVAAAVVLFLIGVAIEITLLRRIHREPELTILATFGLSIVLRQVAEVMFSKDLQKVPNPTPGATRLLGVSYPTYRYLAFGIAVAIVIGVLLMFTRSRFGLRVRAVAANPDLSETVGLSTRRVNLVAFGIGAATAGAAGALLSPLGSVSPHMGSTYLAGAFLVVIAGGVRRMWGVLVGAVVVAAVQTGIIHYIDAVWAQIGVLAMAVVILEVRREQPTGRYLT